MAMSHSQIRNALIAKLKLAVTIPVYVDGENFTPKSTSSYPFVRFTFMPKETVKRSLGNGGTKELGGLAQIDLYYSRSTDSADAAFILSDTIVNAFTPQTITIASGKLVVEMAWSEVAKQEASTIGVPVFIRWSSYQS